MATEAFEGLSPASVWRHFDALCALPRGSGDEERAAAYVLDVAARHGLPARRDGAGNVVVTRPPTPDRRERPTVVLQGHLDMVCEQAPGRGHDFTQDPVRPVRRGEWIGADGTTLGADNGIGVALALAVLEERDRPLPPLEALFTVDEESGLTGASGIDPGLLSGRILLNLDSEEEGTLYIGCAGGVTTVLEGVPASHDAPAGHAAVRVAVGGLRGGHSGLEIHQARGNALVLLARFLRGADAGRGLRVAALAGGSKHNAIPREAEATILVPPRRAAGLSRAVAAAQEAFRAELADADDHLVLTVEPARRPTSALGPADSRRLLGLLLALPHGVATWSRTLPGLVETSGNVAVAEVRPGAVRIVTSQRSSAETRLDEIAERARAAGELAGLAVRTESRYPAWTPDPQAPLLATARAVWTDLHGSAPVVKAVHAGLECGVLGRRFPGMAMLSFGPDVRGAHTPEEAVRIDSVGRVHGFLLALLAAL